MSQKVPKLSSDHICVSDKQPPSASSSKCLPSPLTTLPTELLSLIFSYLSPRDLANIQKLNNERLTEISLSSTFADFSGCNAVREEELLTYFTRDRAVRIQEINLNDVFLARNSILEKCITRCKHLRKLHAYECGLSYSNILSILSHCRELEELYWSFPNVHSLNRCTVKEVSFKLRKLYVTHTDESGDFARVRRSLRPLLDQCTSAIEVCVNFSPFMTPTLPLSMGRRTFVGNMGYAVLLFPYSESLVNVYNSHVQFKIAATLDDAIDGFSMIFTFHTSYLQLFTEEAELNAMPSLPENSVHSLVLILTEGNSCLGKHMGKLKRVTGQKLKHLTVHMTGKERFREYRAWEENLRHDFLTEIVSTCVNIQVLNLSEPHFCEALPLTSLYCLKNLKVLNLAACSLRSPVASETAIPLKDNFESFISYCNKVEVFSLYGCELCRQGPTDEEMMPIAKWSKLTHLLISGVATFRLCHFLPRIVESCPRFASLDFRKIGDPNVCHYTPSVISVLRMSKTLKFLRLEQNGFQPDNSLFWKSVALCQSLQGLCLSSEVKTPLMNKPVTDSIVELPFFHLFHLNIPRFCSNLASQVKSILTKNGVKCMNIHITDRISSFPHRRTCRLSHFPF